MSEDTDKIKDKLNLADLIGEYMTLRRVGGHYKGLCPFHQEKTPSFIVSPDKGIWHCFGCSEGGDAFTFIQKMEGHDFPTVLAILAERTGVTLTTASPAHQDNRENLYDLMDLASRLYHEILTHQESGKRAREYLVKRGVKEKMIDLFSLGYAPQAWDTVQQYLISKGYSLEQIISAGLAGRSDRGTTYDRFRGRIMFPVHDVQGRLVAFGGRILPEHSTGNEGKYINSPETSIYKKRRVVYNLHRAKKELRRHTPCIVVEGYMDVVMLTQIGIKNVVASSGTAFTTEQIQLLKRSTDSLHFSFDADAAGVQAAQSATAEAIAAGMRVGAILLPDGKDPADIALIEPSSARKKFTEPKSLIEILLQRLKAEGSTDRDKVLAGVLSFIRDVANPIQQGEMIQEVATTLHIPESSVVSQLSKIQPQIKRELKKADAEPFSGRSPAITNEHLLIGLLIAYPTVRSTFFGDVRRDIFALKNIRKLFSNLREKVADEHFDTLSADQMINILEPEQQVLAESLRQVAIAETDLSNLSPEQITQSVLRRLHAEQLHRKLIELQQKLHEGTAADRSRTLEQFKITTEKITSLTADQ